MLEVIICSPGHKVSPAAQFPTIGCLVFQIFLQYTRQHEQFERAGTTLFHARGLCDAPREKRSNHCRGNKKENDAFVLGTSYLSLAAVMDDNLGVECVCLSIAVLQSDQGQAPTEEGPVPQLMSSIIQMQSLLSVHCALVHTVLSQAALPNATLSHFDALSVHFITYWNACGKCGTLKLL